jgi:hypothetical protein
MNKTSLISRLESMQYRQATHGNTFAFEVYLGLTFASNQLVDELALLVQSDNQVAFVEKMNMFQDRFRDAPKQVRKALVHYLGKRHGRLESFDDLPEILNRLKK